MGRIVHFLGGSAVYTVTGAFPERFLNLCGQRRIPFWDLEWLDALSFRLRLPLRCERELPDIARRSQCELRRDARFGVPPFLLRFRRRYAFLIGFFVTLAAVCALSRVIFTVEVTGNETVPSAEIVMAFSRLGFHEGTWGAGVDRNDLCQKVLLQVDGLSYCALNITGTRAEIIVREAEKPPAVVNESTASDVVAVASGVVQRVNCLQGKCLVAAGDAVEAGQVLISGTISSTTAAGEECPAYQVCALGEIWAYTRRVLCAEIPLTAPVKTYTGQEKTRLLLTAFGKDTVLFGKSGISGAEYDKITENVPLKLGDYTLPFSLLRETYRAYTTGERALSVSAAAEMLESDLDSRLETQIGGGEILDSSHTAVADGGILTVTLTADCLEQIGRASPQG